MSTRALLCCVLLAFASSGFAAEKKPLPKKTVKKSATVKKTSGVTKTKTVTTPVKTASGATTNLVTKQPEPAPMKLTGKREELTCRDGTEDRHARIGVVLIGGKVDSFAYYSKWKPRTCSVHLQRGRDGSKWIEKGKVTNVSTDKGVWLIEEEKGAYKFVFRDVERERYCGMDGYINGSLTVKRGSEACVLGGDIMVEGTPLGQANVLVASTGEPVVTASAGTPMVTASAGTRVIAEPVAAAEEQVSPRWNILGWFRRGPVQEATVPEPTASSFPPPTPGAD